MVRPGSYIDRFDAAQNCAEFVRIARATIEELAPEDAAALDDFRPRQRSP